MPRLFDQVRAPSTLGVFLRAFTFGHVRQLDAVAARLCAAAPLLPGRDRLAYLDIDDTIRGTYGYAKQGAGRGYSGVNGLPVEYLVADDEGHCFENPENQIMLFHAIERHLAAHLGGRSAQGG